MTAETSNARGEWVLERLRGVLEHGKMGDKCLIAPDLVTAAIAALSAPQPPAEAQPVAKLVNRKDADGGKTTTFIRPTSLGMDLPLGEYPLHLHPPPSAPVGVDAPGSRAWMAEVCRAAALSLAAHGVRNDQLSKVADWIAQQPAAMDEGFVSRLAEALTDQDWDVDPDGDGSGIAQLRAAVVAAQRQEPTT